MPRASFITTSSYGTWLPGNIRGYVQNGQKLSASPKIEAHANKSLKIKPVYFFAADQHVLFNAIIGACEEFQYQLTDVSINTWHLHWLVYHDDHEAMMVGRLKNRMRQKLGNGPIWAKGYWHEGLHSYESIEEVRRYIRNNEGCRLSHGQSVD